MPPGLTSSAMSGRLSPSFMPPLCVFRNNEQVAPPTVTARTTHAARRILPAPVSVEQVVPCGGAILPSTTLK